MRLEFNVLWVDDQPDRVRAQIEAIRNRMAVEGFEFRPTVCRSVDEILNTVRDSVFSDQVDLILVDWDLGGNVYGQDAIAKIRDVIQYKDVVFYSAQTTPKELRQHAFDKELEGVYCASREQLVDEVIGVFESLVKKVLDLDHTRGIVMGGTSDVDNLVNQCLRQAVVMHMDDTERALFFKEMVELAVDQIAILTKQVEGLGTATAIDAFFEAHRIIQSNDRLRFLVRLLRKPKMTAFKEFKTHVTKYQQEVVPKRNLLAHVVFNPELSRTSAVSSDGQSITLDDTRDLRRKILELRHEFRRLHTALAPAAEQSGAEATARGTEQIK